MKQIITLLACFLFAYEYAFTQEFPDYGFLNATELSLKQCDFDKDANAAVLVHEAFSGHDDQRQLITTHHIKIKILKEKGTPSANVSIPFYRKDDFEQIDMVEGMTINMVDGRPVQTKLERKSIFFRKTNDRIGQVIFPFPDIKPGSVIDYKYRSTMKHYGGLEDWNFQEELPVLVSKYTLIILPNMEFAYRVNKTLDIPITIRKETLSGGVYFEMKNIPGLSNEPYMDARRDYLQKVFFQLSGYDRGGGDKRNYMTSWDEVTRELTTSTEFGIQLNKNIPGTEDFIKSTNALASPYEKMKQVFNYVRSNMNWNNTYSRFSIDGVKNAWLKKVVQAVRSILSW